MPYGCIEHLYILPEFRGSGIGTLSMAKTDEYFLSQGVNQIELTVSLENKCAYALYEKSGFKAERMILCKKLKD